MAKITCAISGLSIQCEHLPFTLPSSAGYYHPVFALPRKQLYGLYSKHCKGHLTAADSYLLFLAILHSTGQVQWRVPAARVPSDSSTIHLIENNIAQLLHVIELTDAIITPSFKQPSFAITVGNSSLTHIHEWIATWENNIARFRAGRLAERQREELQEVEKRLSYVIKSGLDGTGEYARVVATWADKAAGFHPSVSEEWKRIIRSCFNSSKMFSIPLADIKEVRSFCEENIEVGSIHFHALMETLKEGISRHTDFLGMNPIALGYTLLDTDTSKNDAEVAAAIASAPTEAPSRAEYDSQLAYVRASLRYKMSMREKAKLAAESVETEIDTPDTETGNL